MTVAAGSLPKLSRLGPLEFEHPARLVAVSHCPQSSHLYVDVPESSQAHGSLGQTNPTVESTHTDPGQSSLG